MPEVQGLVNYLDARLTGLTIERITLTSYSALKTVDPPLDALHGHEVEGVNRFGKFIDLAAKHHLVFHLAKAGWLRWTDQLPSTPIKPGKSPIALRIAFSDGSGFDLTEAGTKKSLAISVVRDVRDVPGIARLGVDPMAPDFTEDQFAAMLRDRRTQIKGLLRDQSVFAGIGNAYSDEILHAARLSPFAIAASLEPDAVRRLFTAMRKTLATATRAADGKPPAELKDAKRNQLSVHGRAGEACPVCGDLVRAVIFADSTLQYCPTCQTGGKVLADRLRSRLIK